MKNVSFRLQLSIRVGVPVLDQYGARSICNVFCLLSNKQFETYICRSAVC